MIPLTTAEVDTSLRDRKALRSGGSGTTFTRVCTDSRQVQAGDLFVALKGDNFDGHAYVAAALKAGASGVIVTRTWAQAEGRPVLASAGRAAWSVDDTLLALGDVARGHMRRLSARRCGLTGSNGKTTTKEFTASILRAHLGDAGVLFTQGNLNNQVGVPQTAFRVDEHHRVALFEMGMNHAGEIAALCRVVEPEAGLITNVGLAHVGNFADGIDGIARAKGELFGGVVDGGTLVINVDDERVRAQAEAVRGTRTRVTYGRSGTDWRLTAEQADGDVQHIQLNHAGKTLNVKLAALGPHNALNACAAAALASVMGATDDAVVQGLQAVTPVAGRGVHKHATNGALVVDDSYNANPGSMVASMAVARQLVKAGGRLVLVIGDMLELGTREMEFHGDVGRAAAAVRPDLLVAAGKRMKAAADAAVNAGLPVASVMHNDELEALLPALVQQTRAGDVVLVKGSRGSRMERAVHALCGTATTGGH